MNSKDQSDQNTVECQGGVGHKYLESSILYLLHNGGKMGFQPSMLLFKLIAVEGKGCGE